MNYTRLSIALCILYIILVNTIMQLLGNKIRSVEYWSEDVLSSIQRLLSVRRDLGLHLYLRRLFTNYYTTKLSRDAHHVIPSCVIQCNK